MNYKTLVTLVASCVSTPLADAKSIDHSGSSSCQSLEHDLVMKSVKYSRSLEVYMWNLQMNSNFNFFDNDYDMPTCLMLQGRALIRTDQLETLGLDYQSDLLRSISTIPSSCKRRDLKYKSGKRVDEFLRDKRKMILNACRR